MNYYAISNIGKIRPKNEDSYFISNDMLKPVFIIADGMGGHKSGEVASKMAVDIVNKNLQRVDFYQDIKELEDDVVKAISIANREIYLKSKEDPDYNGMGTTFTMAYVYNDTILISHVGDSRCYTLNPSAIVQITEDDTLVNSLIKLGEITPEEAKTHPKRNVVTNAVGTNESLDISLIRYKYQHDDSLLICTDGLTNLVTDEELFETYKKHNNLEKLGKELVEMALEKGGNDNITLIIVELEGGVF
ncbi:MAG: Stp1/IreP family PP2C-type Ser/Thr phosphatase [Tissierellia bacterium]|nr:Stp1/IreP family PP2C-type Ser/Thr phosphatase [Tissierellia bacterium]